MNNGRWNTLGNRLILQGLLCIFIDLFPGGKAHAQTDSTDRQLLPRALKTQKPEAGRTLSSTMVFVGDTLLRSPWGAVGRSLLVPGWGQWYNDAPVKGGLFLAADVSLIMVYRTKDKKVNRIQTQRRQIDYQLTRDPFLSDEKRTVLLGRFGNLTGDLDKAMTNRNLYGWLFAISHLLGMIDAYVDAHLFQFDDKMNMAYGNDGQRCYVAYQVRW